MENDPWSSLLQLLLNELYFLKNPLRCGISFIRSNDPFFSSEGHLNQYYWLPLTERVTPVMTPTVGTHNANMAIFADFYRTSISNGNNRHFLLTAKTISGFNKRKEGGKVRGIFSCEGNENRGGGWHSNIDDGSIFFKFNKEFAVVSHTHTGCH